MRSSTLVHEENGAAYTKTGGRFPVVQFADDLFERNYSELDGRFGTDHRGSPAARPRQLCPAARAHF